MLVYRRRWPLAGEFAGGHCIGGSDRAEAVLGLPCGRSGQIGAQVRRHVVHDPLEAKPLKGATKPIRELAIGVNIEWLAGNRGALHDLTLNREHGAAARDLFLAFAQPVDAAKVRRDARQHIAEPTRDLEPRVALKEQLFAIGHLAAPFRRARDHLTGQLPVPYCAHAGRPLAARWFELRVQAQRRVGISCGRACRGSPRMRVPRPRARIAAEGNCDEWVDLRDPIRGAPPSSSRSARRRRWTWPVDRVSALCVWIVSARKLRKRPRPDVAHSQSSRVYYA